MYMGHISYDKMLHRVPTQALLIPQSLHDVNSVITVPSRAPEFVVMTNTGATRDDKVDTMHWSLGMCHTQIQRCID